MMVEMMLIGGEIEAKWWRNDDGKW